MDRVGERLGNYMLIGLIGQGGFADVYLGKHLHLDIQVAIKVLHTQLTTADIEQFQNEGRTIAHLEHPHIVHIRDFDVVRDIPYLVMDYAPNGSLRQRHSRGSIVPLPTVVSYVLQVAQALQYAHDQRVIHRDVKPENMLLGRDDTVMLSDFGIAVMTQSSRSLGRMDVAGTAAYMAPEQMRGKPRPASDQYSLGMVVYEWLAGNRPFLGSFTEIATQHMLVSPPSLCDKNPAITLEVEQVVLKSLSKDPSQRFSNVSAFAKALEQAANIILALEATKKPLPTMLAETQPVSLQSGIREDVEVFRPPQGKKLLISNLKKFILTLFRRPQQSNASLSMPLISDKPPTIRSADLEVSEDPLKDVFISYTRADRSWAKWIKWQLDKVGYTTILLPWGVRSSSDFEKELEEAATHAKRIIMVLSPNYLNAFSTQTTWLDILKQKDVEKLLPVCVQECEQEFRMLLESITHIDLSAEDEMTASAILLAGVRGKGVELAIKPPFPGEIGDKAPTFPGKGLALLDPLSSTSNASISSSSVTTTASLVQQIHIAFAQQDWPDIIRKVNHLSRVAPDTLSPEIYRIHGRALLEDGDKQHASEALQAALALSMDSSQRLVLLQEYAAILASQNRWDEVLHSTQEALHLTPNNTTWLLLQRQSLTQLQASEKGLPQVKSQLELSSIPSISPVKSLEVFFSYSHRDEEMRFELEKYLSNLKRQRSISGWYDGEIGAGNEWAQEIDKHLSQADIVLLLVSQDFIASDYCYDIEMMRALERHKKGEACVVPIILRPAHWEVTHFGKLQALPTGGKPITLWQNHDEAFLNVARGIQKVVDRLTRNNSLG